MVNWESLILPLLVIVLLAVFGKQTVLKLWKDFRDVKEEIDNDRKKGGKK